MLSRKLFTRGTPDQQRVEIQRKMYFLIKETQKRNRRRFRDHHSGFKIPLNYSKKPGGARFHEKVIGRGEGDRGNWEKKESHFLILVVRTQASGGDQKVTPP